MAELSRAKSVHITVTGIVLVVLGSGLFGLLYIVHGSSFTFGKSDIFDRKTAFWVAVPITVTGLVGVLAGISKKNALVTLYMLCSLVSTGLAGFVAVGYGFKVTHMRAGCGEDISCKNSDTAVVIGTIVLIASILITISTLGAIRACQAKWGPSKNPSRIRVISAIQYTRTAKDPAVPKVVDRAPNGHICNACGGVVNLGASSDLNDSPQDKHSNPGARSEVNDSTQQKQSNPVARSEVNDSPQEKHSNLGARSEIDDSPQEKQSNLGARSEVNDSPQEKQNKDESSGYQESSNTSNKINSDYEKLQPRVVAEKDDDTSQKEEVNAGYESLDTTTMNPKYQSLNAKTKNEAHSSDATEIGSVQVNEAFDSDDMSTAL